MPNTGRFIIICSLIGKIFDYLSTNFKIMSKIDSSVKIISFSYQKRLVL